MSPPGGAIDIAEIAAKRPERAWDILRQLALPRHRARLMRRPNVVGVEIGFRETRGQLAAPREPCLRAFVYRKGHVARDGELPSWVTVTDSRLGRIAIRVDVVPIPTGQLQAGNAVASPTTTALAEDASPITEGSLGGLLLPLSVALDARQFVVTAAHLFSDEATMASWEGPGSPDLGSGWLIRDPDLFWPVGMEWNGDQGYLDVALVEVDRQGPLEFWDSFPWGTEIATWGRISDHDTVEICGRRGPLPAALVGGVPPGTRMRGIPWPYWRLIQYRPSTGGTEFGDSGAAIVSAGGALVGMHVGVHDDTGDSLALCAGDILDVVLQTLPEHLYFIGPDGEGGT